MDSGTKAIPGGLREWVVEQHIRSLEAPFVSRDPISEVLLERVGVRDVTRESPPDGTTMFVRAEGRHGGESLPLIGRDRLPVGFETLQCMRNGPVIGVQREEQVTQRSLDSPVERDVLPSMLLVFVSDREVCPRTPAVDQFLGAVGRTVIDDQPLEVAERLGFKALEDSRQRVGTVVRGGEDGEQGRVAGLTHRRDLEEWVATTDSPS